MDQRIGKAIGDRKLGPDGRGRGLTIRQRGEKHVIGRHDCEPHPGDIAGFHPLPPQVQRQLDRPMRAATTGPGFQRHQGARKPAPDPVKSQFIGRVPGDQLHQPAGFAQGVICAHNARTGQQHRIQCRLRGQTVPDCTQVGCGAAFQRIGQGKPGLGQGQGRDRVLQIQPQQMRPGQGRPRRPQHRRMIPAKRCGISGQRQAQTAGQITAHGQSGQEIAQRLALGLG